MPKKGKKEITDGFGFDFKSFLVPIEQGNLDDGDWYAELCKQFYVPIDPSIVIGLKTKWHILRPTKQFGEGHLLPLAPILAHNKYVKYLILKDTSMVQNPNAGNGNSNMRILGYILRNNDTIEHLDISNIGLDADGIIELCAALRHNHSLKALNISRNYFGAQGSKLLEDILHEKGNLERIDISGNALAFKYVKGIERALNKAIGNNSNIILNVEGNYVFEEILNSLSHAVGFILSIIGTAMLMKATYNHESHRHFWACLLFGISWMFSYIVSTLFHSFFMLPRVKGVFKRMDHAAMYLMIAGTYTPWLMIPLENVYSSLAILIFEWIAVLCGVIISMQFNMDSVSTLVGELVMLLTMGSAILFVWTPMTIALNFTSLVLFCGGGVLFFLGIIFFILGRVHPIFHTVWHVFLLAASIMQWCAIYSYL